MKYKSIARTFKWTHDINFLRSFLFDRVNMAMPWTIVREDNTNMFMRIYLLDGIVVEV